jgi:hypothetical protein
MVCPPRKILPEPGCTAVACQCVGENPTVDLAHILQLDRASIALEAIDKGTTRYIIRQLTIFYYKLHVKS